MEVENGHKRTREQAACSVFDKVFPPPNVTLPNFMATRQGSQNAKEKNTKQRSSSKSGNGVRESPNGETRRPASGDDGDEDMQHVQPFQKDNNRKFKLNVNFASDLVSTGHQTKLQTTEAVSTNKKHTWTHSPERSRRDSRPSGDSSVLGEGECKASQEQNKSWCRSKHQPAHGLSTKRRVKLSCTENLSCHPQFNAGVTKQG